MAQKSAAPATQLQFQINPGVLANYSRLAYTAWHALAEFVDNSTQSFFDNRKALEAGAADEQQPLEVSITYDRKANRGKGLLRIVDNAMGMDSADLAKAMIVGLEPDQHAGRSEYGMGMKTAAFWCGNNLHIRTSKLGQPEELSLKVSLKDLVGGDMSLAVEAKPADPDQHYTILELTHLNHEWVGRTLGKIKDYLRSMYRVDIRDGVVKLVWQGEELEWDVDQYEILESADGQKYRRDFTFKTKSGLQVKGWGGVLDRGSRSKAGFTIIRRGRVILGWPDSWKPTTIYGEQVGGSNTLVSQRLFGEIELDGFDVSQTKDKIFFQSSEEEEIEEKIAKEMSELIQIAKERRKSDTADAGPSAIEVRDAVDNLKEEIQTPQMGDAIDIQPGVAPEQADEVFKALIDTVDVEEPTLSANVLDLRVDVWISGDSSPNDPYVAVDSGQEDKVLVIINTAHPHWAELENENAVFNYLRECTYDAIAEWQARRQATVVEPNTVKLYKDRLLRVRFAHDNQARAPEADKQGS